MKKMMKVLFSAIVVVTLFVTSMLSTFAQPNWKLGGNNNNKNTEQRNSDNNKHKKNNAPVNDPQQNANIRNVPANMDISISFNDVDKKFWGYKAIEALVKRGIINGYADQTFKPNAKVTRSEFATMLSKALKLTTSGNTQTFEDVKSTSWNFASVEASKNCLTGYKTSDGKLYFYGDNKAVREDMAVALVKALNLPIETDNNQLQQLFTDSNLISSNLRNYVYTAYKNSIMVGSNGIFSPQGALTRAEAAALLNNALEKIEKVVIDGNQGEKVVVDNTTPSTVKSIDAMLSSITVNGTMIVGFDGASLNYNVVLPSGTTIIPIVAATVRDTGKATVVITQSTGLPGSASVVVTAQDGITRKIYVVNFAVSVAPKSTDATLSNLYFNGTTVTGFNANTLLYNVVLPTGTTAVPNVTAVINDTNKATSVITQAIALPGNSTVLVTAEDGITKKTYTIAFTVAVAPKSTDATLSNLALNGVTVAGFNSNTLTYNVVLAAGTTVVPNVTAVVNDTNKATSTVTQAVVLPGTSTVLVTAEDTTTKKTYTLHFTVAAQ